MAQAALVARVAGILDAGEPTRFAFESAAITGLRAQWCLRSWPWRDADAQARAVVNEALHKLGVSRPSWAQGQREYVHREGYYCLTCGGDIGEKLNRNAEVPKFCSRECSTAFHSRNRNSIEQRATRAEWLAAQLARKDASRPMRTCQHCGDAYRPPASTRPGKYCSRTCANRAINERRFGKS